MISQTVSFEIRPNKIVYRGSRLWIGTSSVKVNISPAIGFSCAGTIGKVAGRERVKRCLVFVAYFLELLSVIINSSECVQIFL